MKDFRYSTEGAIVHHMYTSTAFVYTSAYAIKLKKMLYGIDNKMDTGSTVRANSISR
jgi:hypothetical protein